MTEVTNTPDVREVKMAHREYVGFSPMRVWIIAGITFTESLRQKVYNILLVFALVAIASASFFAQFSFSEQLKFVKDFCLGALSVFGTLIAIVGTSQLLPSEIENRTIYTTLAKPVRRFEFLLGKFGGSAVLILLSLLMMAVMFGLTLKLKESRLIIEASQAGEHTAGELQRTIQQIHAEAIDPDILKAIIIIFIKLLLLASITMFFSAFSTSMVFNVIATAIVFFAGHLRAGAVDMWAEHRILMALLAAVPDLGAFNLADDIILGNAIPWSHVSMVATYGIIRMMVILVAAHLIFSRREI